MLFCMDRCKFSIGECVCVRDRRNGAADEGTKRIAACKGGGHGGGVGFGTISLFCG